MESPARSCVDCIFNVPASDSVATLGQSIGSSACGLGYGPTNAPGTLLAAPRRGVDYLESGATSADTIGQAKAADCVSFDASSHPPFAAAMSMTGGKIMHASVVAMEEYSTTTALNENPTRPAACSSCKYFIPPRDMVEAGLWNVGVCSLNGKIIANAALVATAADCSTGEAGPRLNLVESVNLIDLYKDVSIIDSDGEVVESTAPVEVLEPSTYATDAPVSDEDKARGIRAWRKILEHDSERSVMLPIYSEDFFTPEERAAIPRTGDDEHPENYIDHQGLDYKAAVLWLHLNETPALWGVAGTGKTEFYRYMAWIMCLPFNRISITASTEIEDLAGKMHYEPSRGTYFEYGRIPKAWQRPGIICLDEPNVGPPDVWQFIRPLTDNSKQLVLDMNNGERVSRHRDAYLGMAMNPAWDVKNSGAETLADADGSRLMHIFVELPSEELERKIIKARCLADGFAIPKETLDRLMKIAVEIRGLSDDGSLSISWGIRPQIKVARATQYFSEVQAYRLAAADYLDPQQQSMILEVVRSHTATTRRGRSPGRRF